MEFAYPWMARSVIPKLLIVANNHCTSLEFYDREYETPINGIQVHTWCLCNPKLLTKNEKLFLQWVANDMIHVGIQSSMILSMKRQLIRSKYQVSMLTKKENLFVQWVATEIMVAITCENQASSLGL